VKRIPLILAASWVLVSCAVLAQEEAAVQKTAPPPTFTAQLARVGDSDILLLRNGDKLTGTVLNKTFGIRTSYGQLTFDTSTIAAIDLEGNTNNIESIITINNNKVSGFLDSASFLFELQTGPKIEVRREKVFKVLLRVRQWERQAATPRKTVVLKNGDVLTGELKHEQITISTTYAQVPVKLADVDRIVLISGNAPLTKIHMRNGDLLQGVLDTEDIEIAPDLGDPVKIYQDRIDVIYCQQGVAPEHRPVPAGGPVVRIRSAEDDEYEYDFVEGGLLIRKVDKSSPYYGSLQNGDVIVSIDGQKYSSGRLRPARERLLAGQIPQIVLGIRRGQQTIYITLVR